MGNNRVDFSSNISSINPLIIWSLEVSIFLLRFSSFPPVKPMFSTVEPMLSQWSGHRSPDRSAPTESCSAFRAKRYRQRRADRPPSRAASRRNAAGCQRDVSLLRNWEFLCTRKVRDLEYLKISLKISRKMGIFNHHWCFEHQTFKWVWIRRRHRSPQVFPQSRPNGDGHRRRLAAKNRTKSFSNLFALEIALGNVSSFQVTHL